MRSTLHYVYTYAVQAGIRLGGLVEDARTPLNVHFMVRFGSELGPGFTQMCIHTFATGRESAQLVKDVEYCGVPP